MTLSQDDLHNLEMIILNYEIDFITSQERILELRDVRWSEY